MNRFSEILKPNEKAMTNFGETALETNVILIFSDS